jgi:23S rRNA pseudouridine1911/1915/1917 synthase
MKKSIRDFKIIAENDDFLAINKPAGIVVNDSLTVREDYTVQSLMRDAFFVGQNYNESDHKEFLMRNGLIHRLDKFTSGVLLLAKKPEFFEKMLLQFKGREVKKEYLALCIIDKLPAEKIFIVDAPIQRNEKNRTKFSIASSGRSAVTQFEVINDFNFEGNRFALVKCFPKTGRTHQIRVHLAAMMMPVAGDFVYSGKIRSRHLAELVNRQMLHAHKLSFVHPLNGEQINIEAGVPDDMSTLINKIDKSGN